MRLRAQKSLITKVIMYLFIQKKHSLKNIYLQKVPESYTWLENNKSIDKGLSDP